MKYIFKAMKKSGAIWLAMMQVILTIGYLMINAKILVWISSAIDSRSMHWVNLVILGCIINTILEVGMDACGMYRHLTFKELQNMLSDKLLRADIALFSRFSPGTVNHVVSRIWQMTSLLTMTLSMIRSGAEIVINIIAILLLNRQCALPVIIAFVVGSICVLRLSKLFGKIDKEIDDIKARRSSELDEIINGFTEVRSFSGAIERHMKFITELNNGSVRTFFKRQMLYSATGVTLEASTSIATIIILLYIIASNNVGAIGLSVVMYAWRLEGPFYSLLGVLSEFSDIKAAIPKFNAIMEYRDVIKDGNIELTSFENEISIENVKFSYNKSDTVLDGISMCIPKGASIGICGTSGGGKSTLLKLIPRFYDVDSGSIKIDGINIKELKIDSLRKYMGIVHQSPYIFDGTLRANIVYGRPTATDAEIIDACKKASIYDFIASLPEGLDTKVGPRGLKLSGGQKQRISIARVFLTNPEIIILDEATSALDNETEHLVQDALRAFKGKTTITVAHRLSTIKDCDCIYVVHNHKIAESGSHNELINAGGIYAGMQK